jgi:spore coat polysaccharide biosynthesis protein SpsF
MPRVIASIEARMGSSRLPGKVLADICGKPALSRLLFRLRQCKLLDGIILATSTSPQDDILVDWAQSEGVSVYRGSEEDVLHRVVGAQRFMSSDIVVEVTGDCTLLDPEIIDMGIQTFLENDCDVVNNVRKVTFPLGMDVQVFRFKALEEVERAILDPAVREHVSLYFYEHPEIYHIIHLFAPSRWTAPTYRFQLDYQEDLHFIREIYSRLEPLYGAAFGLEEVMSLIKQEPSLVEINHHMKEKSPR